MPGRSGFSRSALAALQQVTDHAAQFPRLERLGEIPLRPGAIALEHGLIERNCATGRRRRLKASKPTPVWLDSARHIAALLDAAEAPI